MCRHLAYLGPPEPLGRILAEPPHSLYRQSWAPRRQRYGTVNADGFGVGWYAEDDPEPARYRRAGPIWADQSFADLARVVRSGALLAAVRDATLAGADAEAAAAPFAAGPWLFSHNGAVAGWPGSLAPLVAGLPADRRAVPGGAHRLGARVGAGARPPAGRRRGGAGARRHGRRGRRGGPRVPAQPAAHQRREHHGDDLGRHPLVPLGARPAHGRGLRALRRRPALAGGPRPHPARGEPHGRAAHPAQGTEPRLGARTLRRSPARESVPSHPHPARGHHRRRPAHRRPPGPDPHAQDPAAEVVLRRPRQRPVRADHRTARVLPDPRRAGDPDRPRRRDRRGDGSAHPGRTGLRLLGEDAPAPRRPHRPAHVRPGRRQRERAHPGRARPRRRTARTSTCTPSSPTSPSG